MKKLVIIIIIATIKVAICCGQGNTMYPLNDHYINIWDINNTNKNIYYPGNLHLGSIQDGMLGGGSFTVEGNSDVSIKAKSINFKNTHLGSSDPNFKVHASVKSMNVACNYNYVNGVPQVPLFEKIEYGIELPEDIQEKIDLFLNSNTSAANPNHPGLNPYDPQDISVEATITGSVNDPHLLLLGLSSSLAPVNLTAYGFYFQEATPTPDLSAWTVNNKTPYPFRVRFAPPYLGDYLITFKITYWNNGAYSTIDLNGVSIFPQSNSGGILNLNFTGVQNTSGKAIAKGYLEVGQQKRHLRHGYDKTSFFPIGMNIPKPICTTEINCSDPLNNPQGMANRRYEFNQLATNGGNYTRILSFGDRVNGNNCVEITHKKNSDPAFLIGNYQINQDKMMETDLDIKSFEDNGIFATWCLQTYGFDNIPNNNDYFASWSINPYSYELGHANILSFFEADNSKRYFKNRLRYIQARWGYSAAIAIYQMDSEIDDFGRTFGGGNWTSPYRVDPIYAQKGELWQVEMASYIKSINPIHLISSSYVANPTGQLLSSEFPIVCHDKFIYSSVCDIVSWNPYAMGSPTYSAEELNRGRWNAVNEIVYHPTTIEYCNPHLGRFTDKPVFFSEAGMNDGFNIDPYTDIQMHNMIWATACSGMAGVGLQWQGWEAYTSGSQIEKKFQNFNAINSFFDDIDFESHKYEPSVDEEEKLIDKGGSIRVNENMDLEIFVMANDNSGIGEKSDRGFGWVHHRKGDWMARVEPHWQSNPPPSRYVFQNYSPPPVNQIDNLSYNYKLNGFKTGNYLIEIFNTKTAALIYSSNNNDLIYGSLTNVLNLGIPHITLYNSNSVEQLDYAFKFWHASVNGNDLRISPPQDSTSNISHYVTLPGDDGNLKKYFLVSMVPNPASENIGITSTGENIKTVSISDLRGNILYSESSINLNQIDISIDQLAAGVYYVNINSYSGISKVFKLIKI